MKDALDDVAIAFKDSEAVFICAGAGCSADSNLSTYTGQKAVSQWRRSSDNSCYFEINDTSYTQLASAEIYEENPALSWGFVTAQRKTYWNTTPHEGYSILLQMLKKKDYFVCTSNVDGFFEKSGFDSERICEVHGSLSFDQCSNLNAAKDCRAVWRVDSSAADIECDPKTGAVLEIPKCKVLFSFSGANFLKKLSLRSKGVWSNCSSKCLFL